MNLQLITDRLIMRPFLKDDASPMMELYADDDIRRFTGDVPFNSLTDAEAFIAGYDQYEKYNMGRLSVLIKQSGEYIGWCGLKYISDKEQVDIGYRLLKRHRGLGYATEAANASLTFGFNTLMLDKIIGTAMKDNTPSINVFTKLGMKYQYDQSCGCQPGVVYAIKKEEWK
ncbi:GNAT family N-acetyltransferase [Mucilaginibacter segetis]|uniref:GNAT family N-acetyltransferase n=1 Tax=Mucilaginibacter segetis TaxID=2793071 RepID=A0A934PWG9_9SPHI|nr:GNAT family N-acetyltransferase [Mucilaginibacter segetis]MBK0380952.1 GNAT family N-acetyltransferase [Mucilaginibacter segetis]